MKTRIRKLLRKTPAVVALLLLGTALALAGALDQPKADGLIGEQANGYLGLVVADAPADVRALVREVNAKRKARYEEIARKEGIPLSEVEKIGGAKAIERTLPGNYIRDASGQWRRK